MRRSLVLSTLLLASDVSALGAIITSICKKVTAGQLCPIAWKGDGSPVTITIMNGPASNLQPVRDVVTNYAGNRTQVDGYSWMPRLWLTDALTGYALRITQSGIDSYTDKFDIDTTIAHQPPTSDPIILDPSTGLLGGGWDALSAGASSAGYSGVYVQSADTSSAPYPTNNATDDGNGTATITDPGTISGTAAGTGTGIVPGLLATSPAYANATMPTVTLMSTGSLIVAVPTGTGTVGTGSPAGNVTSGPSAYSMQGTTTISTTSVTPNIDTDTDSDTYGGLTATNTPPSPTLPPALRSSSSSDLAAVPTQDVGMVWAAMGGAALMVLL